MFYKVHRTGGRVQMHNCLVNKANVRFDNSIKLILTNILGYFQEEEAKMNSQLVLFYFQSCLFFKIN